MAVNQAWLRSVFGVTRPVELWFGIQPNSAGIFGLPVSIVVLVVVSLLTLSPDQKTHEFVEHLRYPNLMGDTVSTMRA
jgi:cation/acetate symporter